MSLSDIKDWFSSVLMSISAFGLTVNALWNTYITHKGRAEANEAAEEGRQRGIVLAAKIGTVDSKVEKVVVNTDGLTEELVNKATAAAHEKGFRHGQEAGEAKAATLAEGQKQGREESKP